MTNPISLAEIATITSGKRPALVEKEPTESLRVPVIGGGGVSGFTDKALYEGNILVTGRVGTLGKLFSPDGPCWPSDNTLVIFPKDSRTDFRFLRYALQAQIADAVGMNRGAANPLITQKDLGTFVIRRLPLPEQRAIAAVLGALDDKIALNRRMNATLEGMARALFRDWFVDFGPTRAKQAGQPPYLAPGLWSLFPARLDGEGKPEGWEMRRVDQFMELAYGKALRAADRKIGPVPVYGSGGITGQHSEALVPGPSIIIGRKGTVGSLFWEDRPFFPIDTVFYVRPLVPLAFCYYALETLGLDHMNTDAAVPGLNRNNVYRLEVPWPGDDLVKAFDQFAGSIRVRIHNQ